MKIKIPAIAAAEVEAIVFDLGGVILDVDLQRSVEALKALNAEGVGVQDVLAENASVFRDLELGLVTPEAFTRLSGNTIRLPAAFPTPGSGTPGTPC